MYTEKELVEEMLALNKDSIPTELEINISYGNVGMGAEFKNEEITQVISDIKEGKTLYEILEKANEINE